MVESARRESVEEVGSGLGQIKKAMRKQKATKIDKIEGESKKQRFGKALY